MDNSNISKIRPNDYLGVNKMGKNIRKSPLHQPNSVSSGGGNSGNINNTPPRQQPQSHVYNVSKSDFRSFVQQLTGSPLHSQQPYQPPPMPPSNPQKPPSNRLQRIRPPPLTPISRPPIPNVVPVPAPAPIQRPMQGPPLAAARQGPVLHSNNNIARPLQFGPPHFGPRSPLGMPPMAPTHSHWVNPALSPLSAYVQQLQSCINDVGDRPSHPHPLLEQVPEQVHAQQKYRPGVPMQAQPRPPPGPGLLHNPPMPPPIPSPRMNSPVLLPSPTSQFLLTSPTMPSPSGFYNLSTLPKSPYPLFSPVSQFPPPLSPNFSFALMGQSGILGPGPGPGNQPPVSPGGLFPLSPSRFFPISSPSWRDK